MKAFLEEYGIILVVVAVIMVMLLMCTTVGGDAKANIIDTVKNFLTTAEQVYPDLENPGSGSGGVNSSHNEIAAGAYYGKIDYENETVTLYDTMPTIASVGDFYLYGDYIYLYFPDYEGWNVMLATLDNVNYYLPDYITDYTFTDYDQTEYGAILSNINGINVTDMDDTFGECTSLVNAPVIPNSVTIMKQTFEGCTSLVNAPTIPNSVTDMSSTFMGCTSLVNAPIIPNSVTITSWLFTDCTSLVNAPVIPSSVTDMYDIFDGCTSLTGEVEINTNPERYDYVFYDTEKPIKITGSTTMKSQLADTANNGNVTY